MKQVYLHETLVTNTETGEVVSSHSESVLKLPKEPPYIKLYIDDLIKIYGLPKGESRILFEIVKCMNYNSEIVINAEIKRRIAIELNIGGKKPEQIISNSMNRFVKADILLRVGTGVYVANPSLFAKGEWKDIYKLRQAYIEMKVNYLPDGKRTILTEIKELL